MITNGDTEPDEYERKEEGIANEITNDVIVEFEALLRENKQLKKIIKETNAQNRMANYYIKTLSRMVDDAKRSLVEYKSKKLHEFLHEI